MWEVELKEMSDRIVEMRAALVNALNKIACPTPNPTFKSWGHITSQIGMFAFTGLSAKHCEALKQKHHIYCTSNGRFSMAGINSGNVQQIAASIKDVIGASKM